MSFINYRTLQEETDIQFLSRLEQRTNEARTVDIRLFERNVYIIFYSILIQRTTKYIMEELTKVRFSLEDKQHKCKNSYCTKMERCKYCYRVCYTDNNCKDKAAVLQVRLEYNDNKE